MEILQYIFSVSLSSFVGPRNMEEWKKVFKERYIECGGLLGNLVTTSAHNADWKRCGH